MLPGRLAGSVHSGAAMLFRPEAERPSRRRDFGAGPEEDPAAGAEAGFVSDHADRDTVDIRNFGAAQAKRVAATGLLLLGGVGPACHRPHQKQQRGGEHQTDLDSAGLNGRHEYPPKESLKPNTRIVGERRGAGKEHRTWPDSRLARPGSDWLTPDIEAR